jgi:hypothetical protein
MDPGPVKKSPSIPCHLSSSTTFTSQSESLLHTALTLRLHSQWTISAASHEYSLVAPKRSLSLIFAIALAIHGPIASILHGAGFHGTDRGTLTSSQPGDTQQPKLVVHHTDTLHPHSLPAHARTFAPTVLRKRVRHSRQLLPHLRLLFLTTNQHSQP